jgi:hypothetical protein
MNMHSVLIRAAVLLVMCLGLSIAMTRHKPAQANLLQAPATAVAAVTPSTAVLPIVVLPTISVRPSAAEVAAAMNGDAEESDATPSFFEAAQQQPIFATTVSLRSLRLDMPYYSFGKALPRVSKE